MTGKKKIAITGIALGLAAGGATGGAFAYLTDGEKAENAFTIGDVSIEGTEPNYPGNDSDDVKDIVPNEEVAKDPQIDNNGLNDAIVFITLDSPIEEVTIVDDDGTSILAKGINEIFWFKDKNDGESVHANNFDPEWQELPAKEMYVRITEAGAETVLSETTPEALKEAYDALRGGEHIVKRYVFGYKKPIQGSTTHDGTAQTAENRVTAPLFDKVQLKNVTENEIDEAVEKIVIRSFAIQSTNVLENSVDLGTNLNETNLGKIYDIFIQQNSVENDGSGLKLKTLRDSDVLTPTNNGASNTTDPHKNRFGTEEDVTPPNNINPESTSNQEEGQFDWLYGTWYRDDGLETIRFNKDGSCSGEISGEACDFLVNEDRPDEIEVQVVASLSTGALSYYSLKPEAREAFTTVIESEHRYTKTKTLPKYTSVIGEWRNENSHKYIFDDDGTFGIYDSGDALIASGTYDGNSVTIGSSKYSYTVNADFDHVLIDGLDGGDLERIPKN